MLLSAGREERIVGIYYVLCLRGGQLYSRTGDYAQMHGLLKMIQTKY